MAPILAARPGPPPMIDTKHLQAQVARCALRAPIPDQRVDTITCRRGQDSLAVITHPQQDIHDEQ